MREANRGESGVEQKMGIDLRAGGARANLRLGGPAGRISRSPRFFAAVAASCVHADRVDAARPRGRRDRPRALRGVGVRPTATGGPPVSGAIVIGVARPLRRLEPGACMNPVGASSYERSKSSFVRRGTRPPRTTSTRGETERTASPGPQTGGQQRGNVVPSVLRGATHRSAREGGARRKFGAGARQDGVDETTRVRGRRRARVTTSAVATHKVHEQSETRADSSIGLNFPRKTQRIRSPKRRPRPRRRCSRPASQRQPPVFRKPGPPGQTDNPGTRWAQRERQRRVVSPRVFHGAHDASSPREMEAG